MGFEIVFNRGKHTIRCQKASVVGPSLHHTANGLVGYSGSTKPGYSPKLAKAHVSNRVSSGGTCSLSPFALIRRPYQSSSKRRVWLIASRRNQNIDTATIPRVIVLSAANNSSTAGGITTRTGNTV